MAFKQLFTGGACQANGDHFSHAGNPLTTFVDAALLKPGVTRQLIPAPSRPIESSATMFEASFSRPLEPAAPHIAPYELLRQRRNEEQLNRMWDMPEETSKAEPLNSVWIRVCFVS